MDPIREKLTAFSLAMGILLMVGSGVFGYAIFAAGMHQVLASRGGTHGDLDLLPIVLLVFTVGLGLSAGAVAYGLLYDKRKTSGPRRIVADALVLSRYATNRRGDLLSDWELEEADDPRFFVRMRLPGGRSAEYPVAAETYFNCAEGMPGEVELKGRWVGRFTPYVGERPTV